MIEYSFLAASVLASVKPVLAKAAVPAVTSFVPTETIEERSASTEAPVAAAFFTATRETAAAEPSSFQVGSA